MRRYSKEQVLEVIKSAKQPMAASELVSVLGISRQAVHRHLRTLESSGEIRRIGTGPQASYEPVVLVKKLSPQLIEDDIQRVIHHFDDVIMVTLFGSVAKETATADSDVDLIFWLEASSKLNRQIIWERWDQHASQLSWHPKASIVTKKFTSPMFVHTLLLDLPEEHRALYDPNHLFPKIKRAVMEWRTTNGSYKINSFGGKHAWCYTNDDKTLDLIDFRLRIEDVA